MPKLKWLHRSWRTPGTPSRHWRTLAWAVPAYSVAYRLVVNCTTLLPWHTHE